MAEFKPLDIPFDPTWFPDHEEEVALIKARRGREKIITGKKAVAIAEKAIARLKAEYVQTAKDAELWSLEDEELDKLPARTQRIARAARLPRAMVPAGLDQALRYVNAHEKAQQRAQQQQPPVSVQTQNNYVVHIGAPLPRERDEDVKIIDVELLRPEDERERGE